MNNLPSFWRRASFTVPETAALVGVTEETLRTWLARNVTNDFNGTKMGGRIHLSGNDAFYFQLVRDFTGFGVPVRTAMLAATQHANEVDDGLPPEEFLLVRTSGGVSNFELTNKPSFSDRATLVIPLRQMMVDLIDRAAVVYATEESAPPPVKIGTAGGMPIAEWQAKVEAVLDRMPVNHPVKA